MLSLDVVVDRDWARERAWEGSLDSEECDSELEELEEERREREGKPNLKNEGLLNQVAGCCLSRKEGSGDDGCGLRSLEGWERWEFIEKECSKV